MLRPPVRPECFQTETAPAIPAGLFCCSVRYRRSVADCPVAYLCPFYVMTPLMERSGTLQIISASDDIAIDLYNSSGGQIYEINCYVENNVNSPMGNNRTYSWEYWIASPASDSQCAAASALIYLMNNTGNTFYSDHHSLDVDNPVLANVMHSSIHNYGISIMGAFGNSGVHFSGTKVSDYWSSTNIYGVGNDIDQINPSKKANGLTYDQSVLLDQYISVMTNGVY